MREIKFRVWDNTYKRMLFVKSIMWEAKEANSKPVIRCVSKNGKDVYLLQTLMQYTGLKDKRNREIYEGDIIKVTCHDEDWMSRTDGIYEVFWWNGQFVFNANRGHDYDLINFGWWVRSNKMETSLKQVEVIGNIYESPELLEK